MLKTKKKVRRERESGSNGGKREALIGREREKEKRLLVNCYLFLDREGDEQ